MSGGLDALGRGIASGIDALQGEAVFGIGAFLLALVFLSSAVPKLRKPELAALAMVDFGVAKHAQRAAGLALGVGELLLAISLAVAALASASIARVFPVALAAAVLWIFVALIARALRSPDRFACFCFGSEDSTISARTLIRTAALAVTASCLGAAALTPISESTAQAEVLQLTIAASLVGTLVVAVRLPMIWSAFK